MEISLVIETNKGSVKVYRNSNDIKTQYDSVLNCIRQLELIENQDNVPQQIANLDEVLDLLGQLLLVAEEDF